MTTLSMIAVFRFGVPVRCSSSVFRFGVPVRCSGSVFWFGVPVQCSGSVFQFGVPVRRPRSTRRPRTEPRPALSTHAQPEHASLSPVLALTYTSPR